MNHYDVLIEETVVGSFTVEAANLEDAIDKAVGKYKKGIFVNEPGELIAKQVAVIGLPGEELEWVVF